MWLDDEQSDWKETYLCRLLAEWLRNKKEKKGDAREMLDDASRSMRESDAKL